MGQGRVRRCRDGRPYGHPQDSPGARRFDQHAGLRRDGSKQGVSLRCGRRGRLPYVRLARGRRARGTFAGAGTPADERRHDRRTPWSRIDRESCRGIGACGRLRHCSGVATVVGESGASADRGGGRRHGDRHRRMDAVQWGRASLTGHARRAALRVPRQRSRARVSGRRPHRGDQRVARTDRSRAPDRQGSHVGLQGHREDGRADRPGTLGRLSRGEYDSSGGQPAACDRHADSCARSGACLVAVLRSRADQPPGPATGTEHKHRRADSPSAVAR